MRKPRGDVFTALNFLVMGVGCAARGQVAKGLLLLAGQASYIFFLLSFGLRYLSEFLTLGNNEQYTVWNEELQINQVITGDNSMLILLFGILTVAVTILFVYVYIINIRFGFKALQMKNEGQPLPTFREDLKTLWNDKYHLVLLTLPTLGLLILTVLPLIFMISMAFTNFDRDHQPPGKLFTWVGFENFKEILWSNPRKSQTFLSVLGWTLIWAVSATTTCYFGGMALALLINRKGVRFKKMWRAFFAITIAVPQFVSLLLMRQFLNDNGTLNNMLLNLELIEAPIRFLTSDLARVTVIVVNLWVGVPYTLLITTGILMNIPADLYESARIDGASPFVMFRKITLPYMLFVTAPYLITQFAGNINAFNVIFLLTNGNPRSIEYYQAGKTDLLITWLYRQTVDEQDFKLASTIGIIIFFIIGTLSLISFNLFASKKREDEFS
ncbi:MAG: sugar ABC transporter permease [Oscillospiraceae bacterium]|jgi:arabinogalactan oligomer/maltooligosaccharide transport system permease protein|nr:sugar ABC transporter permease [Oscillospiraceae bacterium]